MRTEFSTVIVFTFVSHLSISFLLWILYNLACLILKDLEKVYHETLQTVKYRK